MEDILLIFQKISWLFGKTFRFLKFLLPTAKWLWNAFTSIFWFLKKTKDSLPTIEVDNVVEQATNKVGILKRINYMLTPKAKLTYWLADEEVIVYVDKFNQKNKFSLVYRELQTGRMVLVNAADAINYRLEELKPEDIIETTVVQQDQKY
jgi:hypothetical protein